VTASGSYYLRAYNTVSACWSDQSSGPVTVTYNPAVSMPSATGVTREEPGLVTIAATPGTEGTGIKWYDAQTGGNLLATSTTYKPLVTGTTTFYVSSYNETTGCESSRLPVTATVTPRPMISYTSLYIVMGNPVTLSVSNNSYTTYLWKRDGVNVGTTSSIPASDPGVYTVTVTKNGMTGSGTSESVILSVADMNSITAITVRKEGVTSVSSVLTLAAGERIKTVEYTGGLGNTTQTILSKVSPLQKDIVIPVEYDVLGRRLKNYLPYTSPSDDAQYRGLALSDGGYSNSEQYIFYQTTAKVAHDTKPYATTEVEPSPLGRGLAETGVGNDWHANQKKVSRQYLLNRSTDAIRVWNVNTSGLPQSTATYGDLQLYLNLTTDENGNSVKTWVDKLGRIILKEVQADATTWLKTYSIYDDLGRLAYTLTPEGTKAGNLSPNQAFLDQWAFQYRYDNLNRLVEYKTPAAGWIYTVYDVLNRPVMSQNADQRSRSEWAFVKYDVHSRPVVTGFKVIASSTRASVQASVDAQSHRYELTASNAVGYTLNRTYPSAVETDLLFINYYDNYAFLNYSGWDAEAHTFAFVPEEGSTTFETAIRGLATGVKIRIVNTNTWLNAVQYYDKHYRALQVIAENHLGGLDRNTNKFNNLRQLIETRLSHHNGSVIVLRKVNYDHAGRIAKIYQNINSAPSDQLVAQYEYNELGQLVDKKLHNTTGTSFLQSVDYRYTIRGWLASVNNSQLNVNSANNDETGDYFGMEFLYNTQESGLNNTAFYNGNISAIKWKGFGAASGVADQQSYKYTYDKADRLLSATSQMNTGSAWTKEAGALNEAMTYENNGNIKTLQRNQRKHQLSGTNVSYTLETVDNLTYTYGSAQGNQLAKVEDAVAVATGTGDFKNNANLTTEYTYNTDGNLTADKNKGIDSVHYNMLGKVRRIKFTDGKVITYLYDASGNKLKMKTWQGGTLQSTIDYAGGFVYQDGALSFFGSPEGRVVKNGSTFEYQYAISDHQDNTRVVFTSATPAPDAPTATFEGDGNDGASQYLNVDPSNVVSFTAANHTSGGVKVVRMNQTYKIGPSKSLQVNPGDKVDIEVWEYHEGASGFGSTSTPLTTLITMVSGAFGGESGGGGESGLIYNGVNAAINAFVPGGNQGTNRPAAYLNYILFDENYNLIDMGWQLAPATTFTKQKLSFSTINVKEEGFLFAYLSYDNDSNNWVYFDDFKVTHTPTNVIQYNEYYPFGLQTSNSWTREDQSNNFLYNAGNELNENSGWYETFFRGYDPTLGRFNQVDPMAFVASSHTPYNYGYNDPVYYNDPNGDYPPNTCCSGGGGMGSGGGWETDLYGNPIDSYGNPVSGGNSYRIGPGSGNHWSDGSNYSDWSPSGGSDMYRQGLAAQQGGAGIAEIGGIWSGYDGNGSWSPLAQQNGQLGYYVDSYTDWYSSTGAYMDTQYNGTRFEPLKLTQGDPYLSRAELIDLFRDNFNKEWWDPLESRIRGGSFTSRDVIEYVQNYNYSDIFPKTGSWSLNPVEGGVFQVTDRLGNLVDRFDPFQGYGPGLFPGYLGKIASGELSGRGLVEFTTSSGFTIKFSIILEGRLTN
jgi:RHS repeat-associated protein